MLPMLPMVKSDIRVVMVEPADRQYMYALKREEREYEITYLGVVIYDVEACDTAAIETQAKVIMAPNTVAKIYPWKGSTHKFSIKDSSVDVVFVQEGITRRLGPMNLKAALAEIRRILKKSGRVIIVADKEDERVFGGAFEGTKTPRMFVEQGLETALAKRGDDRGERADPGVTVAWLKKAQPQAVAPPEKKRATTAESLTDALRGGGATRAKTSGAGRSDTKAKAGGSPR